MASSFFRYLDCTNPQKDNELQIKQLYSPTYTNTKISITQKLAYSLKKRNYVKKYQNFNHSLKIINPNIKSSEDQKVIIFCQQKTKNSFQIYKQFSYTINPTPSKLKKSMSTNSSSMVGFPMYLSRQNSFQKDNLRYTQETQLCGAQSTIDESKRDFQRITCNNEVQIQGRNEALPRQTNKSWVSPKINRFGEDNENKNKLLIKGRSEGSLLRLGLGLKRQCSSTLERDCISFDLIEQEQQDRSPTIYEAKRINDEQSVFQQKINQEPSMIQSTVIIKINVPKRKLEQMEIRSTCSIKDSSSGDEFSQVLDESGLTLGKRKFSLAQKLFKEFL